MHFLIAIAELRECLFVDVPAVEDAWLRVRTVSSVSRTRTVGARARAVACLWPPSGATRKMHEQRESPSDSHTPRSEQLIAPCHQPERALQGLVVAVLVEAWRGEVCAGEWQTRIHTHSR